MNNNTKTNKGNVVTWRYENGVVVDLLQSTKSNRLTDIRRQLRDGGNKGIGSMVEAEAQRYTANGWAADTKKLRNHVLRHAKKLTFLVNTYAEVMKEVAVALHANTPVWIYSPHKTPDTVHPTNVTEWFNLITAEQADRTEYAKLKAYTAEFEEAKHKLTALLNTQVDWLDKPQRLHSFTKQFNNINNLRDYISGMIAELKEEGEWDVTTGSTMLQVERSNVYQTLDDKGLRTIGYKDGFNTWDVYEITLADELIEFLSLTYYKHAGLKPLQRIAYNEEGDAVVFKKGEELMTTPIYFEEEHEDDMCPLEEMAGVAAMQQLINRLGIEKLQSMGYEEAKKLLKKVNR